MRENQEMTRRDFVTQSLIALPFLGLTLPEPREEKEWDIDLQWIEKEATWFIWDFGLGETHVFTHGLRAWYIRCGKLWRPGDLFEGTEEEAKAEAQRFTLEKLAMCEIAVEKVVYAIKR